MPRTSPIVDERRTDDDKTWGCNPLHDAYWFVCSFPSVRVYPVEGEVKASHRLQDVLNELGLSTESYVYFIEAVGRDEIKIGLSGDPEKRLKQL